MKSYMSRLLQSKQWAEGEFQVSFFFIPGFWKANLIESGGVLCGWKLPFRIHGHAVPLQLQEAVWDSLPPLRRRTQAEKKCRKPYQVCLRRHPHVNKLEIWKSVSEAAHWLRRRWKKNYLELGTLGSHQWEATFFGATLDRHHPEKEDSPEVSVQNRNPQRKLPGRRQRARRGSVCHEVFRDLEILPLPFHAHRGW